jgi:hypothetical protein
MMFILVLFDQQEGDLNFLSGRTIGFDLPVELFVNPFEVFFVLRFGFDQS